MELTGVPPSAGAELTGLRGRRNLPPQVQRALLGRQRAPDTRSRQADEGIKRRAERRAVHLARALRSSGATFGGPHPNPSA